MGDGDGTCSTRTECVPHMQKQRHQLGPYGGRDGRSCWKTRAAILRRRGFECIPGSDTRKTIADTVTFAEEVSKSDLVSIVGGTCKQRITNVIAVLKSLGRGLEPSMTLLASSPLLIAVKDKLPLLVPYPVDGLDPVPPVPEPDVIMERWLLVAQERYAASTLNQQLLNKFSGFAWILKENLRADLQALCRDVWSAAQATQSAAVATAKQAVLPEAGDGTAAGSGAAPPAMPAPLATAIDNWFATATGD